MEFFWLSSQSSILVKALFCSWPSFKARILLIMKIYRCLNGTWKINSLIISSCFWRERSDLPAVFSFIFIVDNNLFLHLLSNRFWMIADSAKILLSTKLFWRELHKFVWYLADFSKSDSLYIFKFIK